LKSHCTEPVGFALCAAPDTPIEAAFCQTQTRADGSRVSTQRRVPSEREVWEEPSSSECRNSFGSAPGIVVQNPCFHI